MTSFGNSTFDEIHDSIVTEGSGMDFNRTVCKAHRVPTAEVLLESLEGQSQALLGLLILSTLLNVAVYLEEVVFLLRTFGITSRRKKTTWLLAFYPVFSICGLVGCIVPRSATLVDLIANMYFATCLYNFGRLIVNYLGGSKRVWILLAESPRSVSFSTLPVCCCCLCLPKAPLTRGLFFKINLQIMQVAIVRPLTHFIAAVLWTNDSYVQGEMQIDRAYLYITIINATSTLLAVYGLMLLRRVFTPELEKKFQIGGKIASIQLCLLAGIVPNLILNSLLANGKIPCTSILPAKTVAEELLHITWILTTLPFALLARKFFRRREDAAGHAENLSDDFPTKQILVSNNNNNRNTNDGSDAKPVRAADERKIDTLKNQL